jgi:hemerythrin-like domain-containing protein
MSTTPTHPTAQLELPGQAAVADGPHDMSAMYVMHHAFRRDLDRFTAAVRRTPLDDAASWQALARRWERFGMVLHHHHTIEDAHIWPPLLTRVDAEGTPADRATLEAMQAEHETIDPQLEACGAGFAAMAERPSAEERDRLAGCVAAIRDGLHQHLSHEETGALPLVQRYLPEADWQASEKAAQRSFALRDLGFLLPWAASGLDRAARERAFGTAGLMFRILYRLTAGRFDKSEARTFRHA